jgi:hypothetical protein
VTHDNHQNSNRASRHPATTGTLGLLGSGGIGGVAAWAGAPWPVALIVFIVGAICSMVINSIPQNSEHRLGLWKLLLARRSERLPNESTDTQLEARTKGATPSPGPASPGSGSHVAQKPKGGRRRRRPRTIKPGPDTPAQPS